MSEQKEVPMRDGVSAPRGGGNKIPWLEIAKMLVPVLLTVMSLAVGWFTVGVNQMAGFLGRSLDQKIEAHDREQAQQWDLQLTVMKDTLDRATQEFIAVLKAHLERPDMRFSRALDANPADPECPAVVTETITIVNEGMKTAKSVSVQVPLDGIIADRSFAVSPYSASRIQPAINAAAELITYDFQQLRNGEKAKIYLALDRARLRAFSSVWEFLNAQEEGLVVTCEDCPKATSIGSAVVPVYATPTPMPTPTVRGVCRITHVVRAGDTLFSIARMYGTSVWAIARASGIANINMIHSGQVLCIP